MQRPWFGVLAVGLLALSPNAQARRPGPVPVAATPATSASLNGRSVGALTPETIRKRFPGQNAAEVNTALRAARWRPDQTWLDTVGKRYGRLLIVNDTHPSTGQDAVTRRVNPAEDFKPNLQEPDFRNMMKAEWAQKEKDGKVRTLVLNGDTLEFMQTTRAATGSGFHGDSDRYGPLNTPENVAEKLKAIQAGHSTLFSTYAEHLFRGNRLVFGPGNHDRQMLHPTVRKVFTQTLTRDVAKLVLADRSFQADRGKHARRKLARQEARRMVKEQLEFHPWFFMVGDVLARHGNETDKFNAFSTPFGEYYHPGSKKAPMEAALGDYIVKGVFNKVERRKPWTDNTSRTLAVAKAVIQASDYNPVKVARFLRWLITREGSSTNPRTRARAAERQVKDVRRYVREFGLLEKFNTLRPAGAALTEDGLVGHLLAYEALAAKPTLSMFDKNHGVARRSLKLIRSIPKMIGGKKGRQREREMTDLLFRDLYLGTVSVGHDHAFRVEPRLVFDDHGKTATRATILDTATWTDRLPEVQRDAGFVPNERRGVLVVDFDAKGSHPVLMNYDPARGLQRVMVLESENEAKSQSDLMSLSKRWRKTMAKLGFGSSTVSKPAVKPTR